MDYTNINTIAEEITRHPLLEDMPMDAIIGHSIEFMRTMGIPGIFLEKTAAIPVEEFRAELPCDFYEMNQVRGTKGTYRYSTDSFHMSPDTTRQDNTYKLQGSCIFTSMEKDTLEIAYKALPSDENGFPLIPDNGTYVRALKAYIKMREFTTQFELGKITPAALQNAQREYAAFTSSAYIGLIMPSLDQMESITRMWNKMLPDRPFDHETGYRNMNSRQFIKTH